MTDEKRRELAFRLSSISIFRKIKETGAIKALISFLVCEDELKRADFYGEFVYELEKYGYSLSSFLCGFVYTDENRYIIDTASKKSIPKEVKNNAHSELSLFTFMTTLNAKELTSGVFTSHYVPEFANEYVDFVSEYDERLKHISRYGYGIFASARMFCVNDGKIVPVEACDDISIDSFIGYETERKKVYDNTRALLEGRPAANVLLYGDAGTGKSSTVKACVNHFFDEGLRLIEIRKNQLLSLSEIMAQISGNPLKFIIFIDDLSFNKNDDCFSMLKAALEGSASARADNAVIYATSNRRHIVKETFSGRSDADDVHHNDTVQELMSLSDRFGMTVYFEKPNKALYLDIVRQLAQKNGIPVDSALDIKAEAFALNKGSRSPRAAEQFINSLL